jgi:hypothetical protein
MVDLDGIVLRIREIRELSTNLQVAELFKLSPQDFSKRKKRGTLLPIIIEWGINHKVDINWLLTGKTVSQHKGNEETSKATEHQQCDEIESQSIKVLQDFTDKQRALNITSDLVMLEKLDPGSFIRVESYIKGTVDTVKEIAKSKSYQGLDRRKCQRRVQNHPDQILEGKDRRSGLDRRKAYG